MRCDEARPLISAGIDGELEGIRAVQLEAHLTDCAPCSTERESVRATVRLLRALPEAEPPVELRRRIGVALLDVERAVQSRRHGLVWLARPRTAGWAWGAALGAVVAAITLVATRPQAPASHVARLPQPTRSFAPAPLGPNRANTGLALAPGSVSTHPRRSVVSPRQNTMPTETADLSVAGKPTALPPLPRVNPTPRPQAVRNAAAASHPVNRRVYSARSAVPTDTSLRQVARPSPVQGNSASNRPERSNDDSPRLAQTPPASATDTQAPTPSDPTAQDPSGMTQMASGGGMPAPSETEADDLVELRHRLTDRPLQVPELGELKPAKSPRSGKDGWIRF